MKPVMAAYEDLAQERDRLKAELHDEKLNIEGVVDELRAVKAERDRLKTELEMMRTWASRKHDAIDQQARLAVEAMGERDAAQAALEINALALTGERDDWRNVAHGLASELADNLAPDLSSEALDEYERLKGELK